MQEISTYIGEYLEYLHIPTVTSITITDVVEIIIITLLIYAMLVWVKETRLGTFKGCPGYFGVPSDRRLFPDDYDSVDCHQTG